MGTDQSLTMNKFAGQIAKILGGPVLVIGGGLFVANQCLYNVPAGHRGVIYDKFRGVLPKEEGEGTHFVIPIIQEPIIMDITTRPREVPVTTGSKDMQQINISLRVLFRPKRSALSNIYKEIGLDYEERIMPSIVTEVLKTVIAKYDASELITQRTRVSQAINELLEE